MLNTASVKTLFKRQFGHPPAHVVSAPGRLELLGNHTDYNEGLVMGAAIGLYAHMAVSPRNDGRIEIVTSAYEGKASFLATRLSHDPAAAWADYVKGVLAQLKKRGVHYSGFSAAIHSTIPPGLGLSSSAAVMVAAALAVRQLWPYRLTELGLTVPPRRDLRGRLPDVTDKERRHLARLVRAAENEFVGVQCGLLDPMTVLFGHAHQVLVIDCRYSTLDEFPLIGETLVVCDSGVRHQLASGDYNEIRQTCDLASRGLGAKSLRSVELAHLKSKRADLSPREYECAYHVVGEIQRVVFAERALKEDDHFQFGQYMYQSHESSRDYLRNSCPELDFLVELARGHPACLGARLTGGGFGGATVNLVRHHMVEDFVKSMSDRFKDKTGKDLKPIVCQIVDRAG